MQREAPVEGSETNRIDKDSRQIKKVTLDNNSEIRGMSPYYVHIIPMKDVTKVKQDVASLRDGMEA